jgi:hypothetical protein
MLQIRLAASSMEGVNVTAVKFATSGTGNEGSGVTGRLWRDNDGDGQVSGGDVALSTGTISGDNGTLEFSGLSVLVPANGSTRLLVAYDFDSSLTPGTYGVSLEVGQDIEAGGISSSMGITATGAPVAGPLLTLTSGGPGSGAEAVYFMGGCAAGPAGPSGWAFALLWLAASLVAFRVARRGTA